MIVVQFSASVVPSFTIAYVFTMAFQVPNTGVKKLLLTSNRDAQRSPSITNGRNDGQDMGIKNVNFVNGKSELRANGSDSEVTLYIRKSS